MADVLFVCRANLIRSQMAEAIFNNLARGKYAAESAGSKPEMYAGKRLEDVNPMVVRSLKEKGYDAAENKIKQIDERYCKDVKKIVCMTGDIALPPYANKSKVVYWNLPDLCDASMVEYNALRDAIEMRVRNLIAELDKAT